MNGGERGDEDGFQVLQVILAPVFDVDRKLGQEAVNIAAALRLELPKVETWVARLKESEIWCADGTLNYGDAWADEERSDEFMVEFALMTLVALGELKRVPPTD
jgi:hypothetical protein